MSTDERDSAQQLVSDFLRAMEARDLDRAEAMMAPDATLVFPGGWQYASQREMVAAARGRYLWVKKKLERFDVLDVGERTVVYVLGSLFGVNRHGVPFAGIRFVDRFEVRDGLIRLQEVWNDLAESGVLEERPEQRAGRAAGEK